MENLNCGLLEDFINDHSEIALLFAIKQEKDNCNEMYEFIEELNLMGKFLMYSHMRQSLGD